jgi:cytoskeletal protein RodZ
MDGETFMTHDPDPHSQAAAAVHEGRPVEAQYVRQGRRGTHVFRILLISIALVVVGFLVVWGFHMGPFARSNIDNNKQPEEAAVFNAPSEPGYQQAPAPTDPTAEANPSGSQTVQP